MLPQKQSEGQLLGLILQWKCVHCGNMNFEPLLRKEAASGEKNTLCPHCQEPSNGTFPPDETMSEREKMVQRSLSFIPRDKHKQILEDLAWLESLFAINGTEDMAIKYWENLKKEMDYWDQMERDKSAPGKNKRVY